MIIGQILFKKLFFFIFETIIKLVRLVHFLKLIYMNKFICHKRHRINTESLVSQMGLRKHTKYCIINQFNEELDFYLDLFQLVSWLDISYLSDYHD